MKIKFKAKKSIGTIWAGATTVVALAWVITLYSNVRQGRTEVKAMAIQTLRKVAEQAVSREFDRLGEYYLGIVQERRISSGKPYRPKAYLK